MSGLIFFYGTLRPALARGKMRQIVARLERVGLATLPGRLFDLGPYPAALPEDGASGMIVGEVFRLPRDEDLLPQFDRHESFLPDDPARSLYLRLLRTATMADGQAASVWVYSYNRDVGQATLVPNGDYVAWKTG
ncbi:MAG: gamma-glutamylcyclotransferase [Pirellulales bacterium]